MKSICFVTCLAVLISWSMAAYADGVRVYARNAERIAKITVIGELYNGNKELAGSGSGFLIGERSIITASHVIPVLSNYRSVTISTEFQSASGQIYHAELDSRDSARDLAVLVLDRPNDVSGCPVYFRSKSYNSDVETGEGIYVIGFPIDKPLSISSGILSNKSLNSGEWQTDVNLNPGNSGGPVFDRVGRFVGVAVRRTSSWISATGDKFDVDGIGFFVPIEMVITSAELAFPNSDAASCWEWQFPGGGAHAALEAVDFPERIRSISMLSRTKDDHPDLLGPHSRFYQEHFVAMDGYVITACELDHISANNAHDITCNISLDRKSARLDFRLESGPIYDRWRGWLHTKVAITQERNSRD